MSSSPPQLGIRRLVMGLGMVMASMLSYPPASAAPALPNLVAVPPFDLGMGVADGEDFFDPNARRALRFSVAIANRGDVPLEVVGITRTDRSLDALQCVDWIAGFACTAHQRVGSFRYHEAHGHWHFDGFALYEIRYLREDGSVDWDGEPATVARKVSFCMADSAPEDDVAIPPKGPRYSEICPGVLQGISPGWRDVYGEYLEGQQMFLDTLPDGRYALSVTANPDGVLLEEDASDNRAHVVIEVQDGALAEGEPL